MWGARGMGKQHTLPRAAGLAARRILGRVIVRYTWRAMARPIQRTISTALSITRHLLAIGFVVFATFAACSSDDITHRVGDQAGGGGNGGSGNTGGLAGFNNGTGGTTF